MSDTLTIETKPQNAIFVSEKAAEKVWQLMQEAGVADDPSYFLRGWRGLLRTQL